VPSKPDFVLHVGKAPPTWADVELLFEHTRSHEAVTKKFSQWLRGAWSVFYHQPFRLHLYGIMFIQPYAYVCYADHGCAVYSEPLSFATNNQHTQFLADFLTRFIANPKGRGRDPTVKIEGDMVHIDHAETTWAEKPDGVLCYRPSVIGRNIRVAEVWDQGTKFPNIRMVMKSTWEEKLRPTSSPPSEVEVLKILLGAKVRGLPLPYALGSAIVRNEGNSEVETRSEVETDPEVETNPEVETYPEVETHRFPENCAIALPASTANSMAKLQSSFVSRHISKECAPGANVGNPSQPRVEIQRQQFNKPLGVRRRLTRVLMSYCVPLNEAMRTRSTEELMQIIRDAMIVYYEAYKSGFIHGGKHFMNVLCSEC
jgi:Fungal protein kinase